MPTRLSYHHMGSSHQPSTINIEPPPHCKDQPQTFHSSIPFGAHDFNKIPLPPPGTQVIIHSKPAKRASWVFHEEDGLLRDILFDLKQICTYELY